MYARDVLNRDQRRAVAARLAHVEQAVQTVADVLAGPPTSLFKPVSVQLSAAQRRQIAGFLAELRSALQEAATQLDVPIEPRDGVRIAQAAMNSAWEGIEDARTATLGRYGSVHPDLAAVLDPHIERLIELVLGVLAVLEEET